MGAVLWVDVLVYIFRLYCRHPKSHPRPDVNFCMTQTLSSTTREVLTRGFICKAESSNVTASDFDVFH